MKTDLKIARASFVTGLEKMKEASAKLETANRRLQEATQRKNDALSGIYDAAVEVARQWKKARAGCSNKAWRLIVREITNQRKTSMSMVKLVLTTGTSLDYKKISQYSKVLKFVMKQRQSGKKASAFIQEEGGLRKVEKRATRARGR